MTNGFTRQETIAITGVKSGRLSYLDKTGLVVPEKCGNPKHPRVIYDWEKILQIKIIERLREKLSLQEIRKIIEFLRERHYNPSLFNCKLVFIDKQLYLIENWERFGNLVLEASGANKGQIVIQEIGAIGEVLLELREEAERNHILDFNKRAKGTPLENALIRENHVLEEDGVSVSSALVATWRSIPTLQPWLDRPVKMAEIPEANKFSPAKTQVLPGQNCLPPFPRLQSIVPSADSSRNAPLSAFALPLTSLLHSLIK